MKDNAYFKQLKRQERTERSFFQTYFEVVC